MARSIDAMYAGGVFTPLDPVGLPDNQRVRLTVETTACAADAARWLAAAREFQASLRARRGTMPDSAADIRAERHRHD